MRNVVDPANVRASRSMPGVFEPAKQAVTFHTLRPGMFAEFDLQPAQRVVLGMANEADAETAEQLAASPIAWAARRDCRLIALFGILETVPGRQGFAWAMLAAGIGAGHHALTRFIQGQIAACGLVRLELLARAPELEEEFALEPPQDAAAALRRAWARSTPEMRWATLLGLSPAMLVRCFAGTRDSFVLFERIDPALARPFDEAGAA